MTASVLAFEKKIVPSDGYMYGAKWEKRKDELWKPLQLKEKSVRGTISNRLNNKDLKDLSKLDAKVTNANLQTVDSCGLEIDQDTLVLSYTLKFLSGIEKPSACNDEGFLKNYQEIVNDYISNEGFKELAKRYAFNIASARALWRNRVGAERIEVLVRVANKELDDKSWTFDATSYRLNTFTEDDSISELANLIAETLSGKREYLMLEIDTFALVGTAQDVYPSEELVLDKSNNKEGKKSKILYSINDIAAMHSQKIGNAIRTIDTWYPGYADNKNLVIAAEPYGAVTNMGKAYRKPKDDFFTLFDNWVKNKKIDKLEDKHFVMAVLVRGGVFGESEKE